MKEVKEVTNTFLQICGLNEETYKTLKDKSEVLLSWKGEIAETLSQKTASYLKSDKLSEEKGELGEEFLDWYDDVVSGNVNDAFLEKVWHIGLSYIEKGVKNTYMMAMMNIVQSKFIEKSLENFEPSEAKKMILAFNTITDAITTMIIEGYISLYIEAVERMSGIKKEVVDRMATLESKKMLKEYEDNSLQNS